jgi:hypothetical protein
LLADGFHLLGSERNVRSRCLRRRLSVIITPRFAAWTLGEGCGSAEEGEGDGEEGWACHGRRRVVGCNPANNDWKQE